MINRKICIAPMLDWTDKHYRYFIRLLSKHTLLYTEMVTTGALIHGHQYHLLEFNPQEHPIALQLGGCVPQELAQCARLAESYGYNEVNLNVGCPSDRVQKGRFGACLMAEPNLVAESVAAMRAAVKIPITVKTRIGIDNKESYEELYYFIDTVHKGGCDVFIIHARKAWLSGLSPKENREIPPLRYDIVLRLKQDFPYLTIILNGGIKTHDEIREHLHHFDGVMIGREAYQNPYLFACVDRDFYEDPGTEKSRLQIMQEFIHYMIVQMQQGVSLKHMSRHILGFFNQVPGAKQWRRYISENAYKKEAGIEVIEKALQFVFCDQSA